jgi:hypothetical protein
MMRKYSLCSIPPTICHRRINISHGAIDTLLPSCHCSLIAQVFLTKKDHRAIIYVYMSYRLLVDQISNEHLAGWCFIITLLWIFSLCSRLLQYYMEIKLKYRANGAHDAHHPLRLNPSWQLGTGLACAHYTKAKPFLLVLPIWTCV